MLRPVLPLLVLAGAPVVSAQSNGDATIDIRSTFIEDLRVHGRSGAFPNGVNGCSFQTVICNAGSSEIVWEATMDPDHPFLAFLLARESGGRFEQISDRSYVKHAVFAAQEFGCGGCLPAANGTRLGVGCSDTYSAASNSNQLILGPPDEIDPWQGTWNPFCSHFDRGEPPAAAPQDCDGIRSLTSQPADAIAHVVRVRDADLAVPGAQFWFQLALVVEGELESKRGDNLSSRGFVPSWNGSVWSLAALGNNLHGSVLERWQGASVASSTNGADDGRFYVGVRVTGPDASTGLYHYEYAVHDRDNARGASALRIPLCASARVLALGFSDVDELAGNDWTAAVAGGEIVFSGAANPLRWNSIFNFWFDSDAAPLDAPAVLVQASPGPGAATVSVASRAPLLLPNVHLGPGCALGAPPRLFAIGSPPRATLGNASFGLRSTGNAPGQPCWLRYSLVPGSFALGGCALYLGPGPGHALAAGARAASGAGVVEFGVPVPNDLALEGLSVQFQVLARDPGNGALRSDFELSNGLRVRIGSAIPDCP